MYKLLAISLSIMLSIRPADLHEIEVIQATQKIKSVPSLKTLASKTIIQQMDRLRRHKDDDKQRAIIQEYAHKSILLPEELQEAFKRRFAKYGMDVLLRAHKARLIYPNKRNYTINFDGTLLLSESTLGPRHFILKNIDSNEEKSIHHPLFSGCAPDGGMCNIRPYLTQQNIPLFSLNYRGNSIILKYDPKTSGFEQILMPQNTGEIQFISSNARIFLCSCPQKNGLTLYNTKTTTTTEILGHPHYIDDDYLVTIHNERFHCYITHDGNLYLHGGQGTDNSIVHSPHLICTTQTYPNEPCPTSLEIWNLTDRQAIRRIVLKSLPAGIFLSCRNDKLEYRDGSAFYSLDLKTGIYKENRPVLKGEQFSSHKPASFTNCYIKKNCHTEFHHFLITRTVRIPLVGLCNKTMILYGKQTDDLTRMCGFIYGCIPFIYTTPLHTLHKTPLPELFKKLLELNTKTIE